MDKNKKLSAVKKTMPLARSAHSARSPHPIPLPMPMPPPPPKVQSYSYYLSNSTYIDDKNKVEKHLEIKSNGKNENGHYMEKKNGEIKINLHDMDKIKRYLKKI